MRKSLKVYFWIILGQRPGCLHCTADYFAEYKIPVGNPAIPGRPQETFAPEEASGKPWNQRKLFLHFRKQKNFQKTNVDRWKRYFLPRCHRHLQKYGRISAPGCSRSTKIPNKQKRHHSTKIEDQRRQPIRLKEGKDLKKLPKVPSASKFLSR